MGIYFGKNIVEGNLSSYFSSPMGMSPQDKGYKALQCSRIACACLGIGLVVEGTLLLATAISCGINYFCKKEETASTKLFKEAHSTPSKAMPISREVHIQDDKIELFQGLKRGNIININGTSYEITCSMVIPQQKTNSYYISHSCDAMWVYFGDISKLLNLKKLDYIDIRAKELS